MRLPRLPGRVALVDQAGNAAMALQRWWQSVVENVETTASAVEDNEILTPPTPANEPADPLGPPSHHHCDHDLIPPSPLAYTDEMAQDAVGGILSDAGDIDFTYDDETITAAVKSDAITYAKMQNVSATDKLLGRATAGAGDVEEIACTAAGRALLDDADAAAQRATLGLVIGANVQAYDADLDAVASSGLASAWTTYTPTVTAGSGAFTSVSAQGRYLKVGKTVDVWIRISITTNGTAASYIDVTVPFARSITGDWRDSVPIMGIEVASAAFSIQGVVINTTSTMRVRKYDASYPGADGYELILAGRYEVA